jgi:PKD repeat protein
VSDDLGGQSCCDTQAHISPIPPPTCDAGGPYEGVEGEPVQLDGTGSSAPAGVIVTYEWEFGDGESGSGPHPAHVYAAPDVYVVTLCVTDDGGRESCCQTSANIVPFGMPVCNAGGPYSGQPAQSIQFDGTGSYDPNGTIVGYEWEFGDGGTAVGPMPSHTYSSSWIYEVTLCVTDNEGNQSCCDTQANVYSAGGNDFTSLPLHAVVTSFGICQIPDPCPNPTLEVQVDDFIAVYLLIRNYEAVAGVQTAFEWGDNVYLFGLWDCQTNQVNGVTPQPPGGQTAGTITSAFDCVSGGASAIIGRMHLVAQGGCIWQVQSSFPFGTHVVDCTGGVSPVWADCMGSICVGAPGINACDDCAAAPLEPTTWGQIKARYR